MKLAIIAPNKPSYTETFVNNHIDNLPYDKVLIYGTDYPNTLDGYKLNRRALWYFRIKDVIYKKIKRKRMPYREFLLKHILLDEKVDVVFCEFLNTASKVIPICRSLDIPVFAIALGYEISMKNILATHHEGYKALCQYATKIFVVAKSMREPLLNLHCPEEKIVWSPAGPAPSFFELRPQFKKKQLFCLGRFIDKKAPYYTIWAFAEVVKSHPEATLIMAGDGPLLQTCIDLVHVLSLNDSVEFIGRITQEQQRSYLESSYMFLQHSKVAISGDSEGTPVAILEASASGLPVVSTLHSGIPDVIIDQKTGLLCTENDVVSMSQNMIDLLDHPEKARQIGERGRTFVKSNFTLENHIAILKKEIDNVN